MNKYRGLLRYGGIIVILGVFLLLTVALIGRDVWRLSYHKSEKVLTMADPAEFVQTETESPDFEAGEKCLYLWQQDEQSLQAQAMMEPVLAQMKVPYVSMEAAQFQSGQLKDYGTVVLAVTTLGALGEGTMDIVDWVNEGGKLLCLYPPAWDSYSNAFLPFLGIMETGSSLGAVDSFQFVRPFMPGGEGNIYRIDEPYESSMLLHLTDDCDVYMESVGDYPVPLIWKRQYGQGTVVMSNLGYIGKSYRGIYAAAFSLLDECFAWPVINGAVFFLDEFPAPVPGGSSEYIQRDYGQNIDSFITNVWWRDMQSVAKKHQFPYTGMVVEQYSGATDGTVERNEDIVRYQYFGNAILGNGGELGYNGYNYMPLVLENFDFTENYESYSPWTNINAMKTSMDELVDFCGSVFPREDFQIYSPPSNILSEEGRQMLASQFPQIKAIAGTYIPGEVIYEQEFEVADDGIVEIPRTVSGFAFDNAANITALSELTFHFVSSYFAYPDEVLDTGSVAELGWEEMLRRFSGYTDWLFESAPDIRRLTGSELAGAVQRYDNIEVHRLFTEDSMKLELNGFYDEAWLMVRFNGRQPGEVTGGSLTKILDGLYLLKAEEPEVEIMLEEP